jgi:hypothetical protein
MLRISGNYFDCKINKKTAWREENNNSSLLQNIFTNLFVICQWQEDAQTHTQTLL